MTDYAELYRQLAREILRHEGKIERSSRDFVVKLAGKLRAQGYQLTSEIEAELTEYLDAMQGQIKTGIEKAVEVAIAVPGLPQSATVAKLTEQAFNERWPDGLRLSDRLWNFNETARNGLTDVLRNAAKTGESTGKTIYNMQRTIERAYGGQRFKIVEQYADDWVKELHDAATQMIHDPESRVLWNATVADVQERIENLKVTGTRRAAERVFDQIKTAVAKGREELADKAVKWWLYDKQLYSLKRIARTEMADAMHRAVIAGTEDDETIIGYQWRLSASHPVVDICDYYASVEMGLGKGVFTKEAVPQHKAHPHCMCLLIPRATPIRERGNKDYEVFIKNLSAEQQQTILPKWASHQMADGKPLAELIRPDGFGLISKRDFLAKQVADIERLPAADAKRSVAEIVNGKAFARFANGSDSGYYPVGIANTRIRSALGASVQTVRLSGDDRDKQIRKGSEQGRNRYAQLQAMIDHGEVIQYIDRAVSVFWQIDGQWHHAALKSTQAGDEIYLKSLRRSDEKQLERDRKRGRIISAG